MPADRFALSAEELETLSQVGDRLAPYGDELAAGWQGVLEATAVFHERPLSSEELAEISQRGTAA